MVVVVVVVVVVLVLVMMMMMMDLERTYHLLVTGLGLSLLLLLRRWATTLAGFPLLSSLGVVLLRSCLGLGRRLGCSLLVDNPSASFSLASHQHPCPSESREDGHENLFGYAVDQRPSPQGGHIGLPSIDSNSATAQDVVQGSVLVFCRGQPKVPKNLEQDIFSRVMT
jgi:hypothetical protein